MRECCHFEQRSKCHIVQGKYDCHFEQYAEGPHTQGNYVSWKSRSPNFQNILNTKQKNLFKNRSRTPFAFE